MKTILQNNPISWNQVAILAIFIVSAVSLLLLLALINRLVRTGQLARQGNIPAKLAFMLDLDVAETTLVQQLCQDHQQLPQLLHDRRVLDDLLFHAYHAQQGKKANETELDLIFRIYRKHLLKTPPSAKILSWKNWPKYQELLVSSPASLAPPSTFYLIANQEDGDLLCESNAPPNWQQATKLVVLVPFAGSGAAFHAQQRSLTPQDGRWQLQLRMLQYDPQLSGKQQWPPLQRLYNLVVDAWFLPNNQATLAAPSAREEVMLHHLSSTTCSLLLRCPPVNFQTIILPIHLEHEQPSFTLPLLPESWQPLLSNGNIDHTRASLPADYRPTDGKAWRLMARIHPETSIEVLNRVSATVYHFYDRYYSRVHNKQSELPRISLKDLHKIGEENNKGAVKGKEQRGKESSTK